jgi:P pilus assembly chaperone PapD
MKKIAIILIAAIFCVIALSFTAKADFKDMVSYSSFYTISEGKKVPIDVCTTPIGQYGIQLIIESDNSKAENFCLTPPMIEVDK